MTQMCNQMVACCPASAPGLRAGRRHESLAFDEFLMAWRESDHSRAMRTAALVFAWMLVGCDAASPETVGDLQANVTCSPSDYQDWLRWAPDDDGDPRPRLDMQCLPRELERDVNGFVNCVVIEARADGDPACGDPGRRPVSAEHEDLLDLVMGGEHVDPAWTTVCEVEQLTGEARTRCEQEWPTPEDPGYCYLSNDLAQVGSGEMLEGCGWQPPHALRFSGDTIEPGGITFIACNDHLSDCD